MAEFCHKKTLFALRDSAALSMLRSVLHGKGRLRDWIENSPISQEPGGRIFDWLLLDSRGQEKYKKIPLPLVFIALFVLYWGFMQYLPWA